jgi:ribosome biogenesis SPOUT family RNA methylase Rps3
LLDPAAAKDLSPQDGDTFDIFLFGGILGKQHYYFRVASLTVVQEMTRQEVRD